MLPRDAPVITFSNPIFWVNKIPVAGEQLRQLILFDSENDEISKIIEKSIIDAECDARQIQAEPSEIDQEMNQWRRSKRLFSAKDTKDWLQENGLNDRDLENHVVSTVRRNKLKKQLTTGEGERKFAMEKWRFDSAVLYRIRVSRAPVAEELVAQLNDGAQFFGLAKKFSEDRATAPMCGYMGVVRRETLRPEVETEVFNAESGAVIGPINSIDGFHIYLVESVEFAELTNEIVLEIEDKLFSQWLKEKLENLELTYPSCDHLENQEDV